MTPPFATQQSLFRAYDIRGDKQYFTSDFITALADAFFRLYSQYRIDSNHHSNHKLNTPALSPFELRAKKTTVIVGFDVRAGSECIAEALTKRIQQRGLQVIYLGLVTTPMMAFWTEQYDGHGIMVTASHSPKDTLGVKWLCGNASPSETDIYALFEDLSHSAAIHDDTRLNTTPAVISLPTDAVATPYIEAIQGVFSDIHTQKHPSKAVKKSAKPKLDMTIVIDCMHGATSRIAAPLFTTFCARVIIINDTPDGTFPMGNPDPTEPNRLAQLQQMVIVNQADIGLAFDGDGDRLMIVDDRGKVVLSDHLLYLLARVAITERSKANINPDLTEHHLTHKSYAPTPQVLFDVKCSHHLPTLLEDLGAAPVISRTGSGFMRERLRSDNSPIIFAGELSGHFIFNDGYFTAYDDAMYAGLRLLHWLAYTSEHNHTLSPAFDAWGAPVNRTTLYRLTDITSQLPSIVITSDHYLPMIDKVPECSIIKRLATHCHYLQCLVNTVIDDTSLLDNNNSNDDKAHQNPLCTAARCNNTCCLPRITTYQAQELLPKGTKITCIDGVRLDFARGFGVLRQSNTSHSLTVRFAADSSGDLKTIQAHFVTLCEWIDKDLAKQIASIYPE